MNMQVCGVCAARQLRQWDKDGNGDVDADHDEAAAFRNVCQLKFTRAMANNNRMCSRHVTVVKLQGK